MDVPEQEKEEVKPVTFLIPDCCREGWDTCKHVPRREKPKKQNIGL